MIKISGNDINRDGEKIGWIEGNDVRDLAGRKLGYVIGNDIHRQSDGLKIAYINGECIVTSAGRKINLCENNQKHVTGGLVSDVMRAAIRLFFGD